MSSLTDTFHLYLNFFRKSEIKTYFAGVTFLINCSSILNDTINCLRGAIVARLLRWKNKQNKMTQQNILCNNKDKHHLSAPRV